MDDIKCVNFNITPLLILVPYFLLPCCCGKVMLMTAGEGCLGLPDQKSETCWPLKVYSTPEEFQLMEDRYVDSKRTRQFNRFKIIQ